MSFLTQGKTKWKYVLIVATLAIIVGTGILWWINQQDFSIEFPEIKKAEKLEDETVNWKTYRSEAMKFEIRYPSTWEHSSQVLDEIFGKKFIKDSNEFVCRFDVAGILTESFDDYMKDYYLGEIPQYNEININEISAIKVGKFPYHCSYWVKREDGGKFSVQITQIIEKFITNEESQKVAYGYVNDPECLNIFNQILSTFRFLE